MSQKLTQLGKVGGVRGDWLLYAVPPGGGAQFQVSVSQLAQVVQSITGRAELERWNPSNPQKGVSFLLITNSPFSVTVRTSTGYATGRHWEGDTTVQGTGDPAQAFTINYPAVVSPYGSGRILHASVFSCDAGGAPDGDFTYFQCAEAAMRAVYFNNEPELRDIRLSNGSLGILDVSGLDKLERLDAQGLKLRSLNIQGCNALKELRLFDNLLPEVNLTGLVDLELLELARNPLRDVDLTGLVSVRNLEVSETQLASLDLSDLVALESLSMGGDFLDWSGVTLPPAPLINELYLAGAGWSFVDLSALAALTDFGVYDAAITAFDFSGNPDLVYIEVSDCPLSLAAVDAMFNSIQAPPPDNGEIYAENMPVPSAASQAKRDDLTNAGWDIYTD